MFRKARSSQTMANGGGTATNGSPSPTLPPYDVRTIGVIASQFVTNNGHYQVYLTVGDENPTMFNFNYAVGQVTEST